MVLHLSQDDAGHSGAPRIVAGGQAELSTCWEGGMLAPASEPVLSQL